MRAVTIDYRPTPKQALFHASTANEILYGGAAGGGKLLEIFTNIPTTNGWVKMRDIAVGDMVFGMDGLPHPVTKVSSIQILQAWKLTFDDGSEIVCNDDHLWLTYNAQELSALTKRNDAYRERRRKSRPSRATGNKSAAFTASITKRNQKNPPLALPSPTGTVRETSEIVKTLKCKNGRSNHAVPVTSPIQLPPKELPLAPYLLGLWLGDGTSHSGGFTGIDGLEKAFKDAGFSVSTNKNQIKSHYITGLVQIIKQLGLYKNKHIPSEYLWASEPQRLALLQGLMDTDGNCNLNGSAEFVNTNKSLVDGAAFLIRSLGMKTTIREGRSKLYGKDYGPKWIIKFVPSMPVFRLQRKLERQKIEQRRTTKFRYIVSAERMPEPVPMKCIAIDSADRLYLAGEHFIPTHNTCALILDALMRTAQHPNTRAYIFRRTFNELEDTDIREARARYPKEIATYNVGRHEFSLVNGSKILFRHCENAADRYNYSGAEIDFLYFDELTAFEKEVYDFIKTRLRSKTLSGVIPIVRSASNPGNIGHMWVKNMFVDSGPYMELRETIQYSETLNAYKKFTIQYIPALATENPHITNDYIFELERKPEKLRKALLFGHWDAFEGQVFTEFVNDPRHYIDRINTHVIDPFEIPLNWPRYMAFDHGYSTPFSIGWWAVDPKGRVYGYREWYGSGLTPRQLADGILEREKLERANNLHIIRVADPHIFDTESDGLSIAKQMEPNANRGLLGLTFRSGDNARIAGKMQLHERLRFDSEGKPMLYLFTNCENWIRTVPNLPYSRTKVEDVDTDAEDHAFDQTRYFLMERPIGPKAKQVRQTEPYGPYRGVAL